MAACRLKSLEASEKLCLKNTFLEVPVPEGLQPVRLARSVTCPADLIHECVSTDAEDDEDDSLISVSPRPSVAASTSDGASTKAAVNTTAGVTNKLVTAQPYTPPDANMQSIPESQFTTIMLRHIPNKYTQQDLLRAIDAKGFRARYDFFYLPADFRSQSNCGYAFINFRSPGEAADFARVFRGFRLPALRSSKVCDVSWARIQGLAANVEHYRNNPINSLADDFFKPLLFVKGVKVDFPKPDRPGYMPHPVASGNTSSASLGSAEPAAAVCARSPRGAQNHSLGGKIFIGGLSPETTESDLIQYFSQHGRISEAAIVADKKSGMSRGFGFCCFAEAEAVDRVLGVRQHLVLGQSVGVRKYARSSNVH